MTYATKAAPAGYLGMRERFGVLVLAATACLVLALTPGAASARAPGIDTATASLSLCGPCFEKWQRQIVRDRDRARRGELRLGALSDGYFEVRIAPARAKIVILMPPLRAKLLERTRRLVAKRYGDMPVELRLASLARPRRMGGPATPPRPGKPLFCAPPGVVNRGEGWNAKRIIGRPLAQADRIARRHNCAVRVVLIDGMTLIRTADLLPNRINVVVRGGRVTRILGLA